jgi:hypothetical protein
MARPAVSAGIVVAAARARTAVSPPRFNSRRRPYPVHHVNMEIDDFGDAPPHVDAQYLRSVLGQMPSMDGLPGAKVLLQAMFCGLTFEQFYYALRDDHFPALAVACPSIASLERVFGEAVRIGILLLTGVPRPADTHTIATATTLSIADANVAAVAAGAAPIGGAPGVDPLPTVHRQSSAGFRRPFSARSNASSVGHEAVEEFPVDVTDVPLPSNRRELTDVPAARPTTEFAELPAGASARAAAGASPRAGVVLMGARRVPRAAAGGGYPALLGQVAAVHGELQESREVLNAVRGMINSRATRTLQQ